MLGPNNGLRRRFFEHTHELVQVHEDRTCAGRITKQLRRILEAFVIRRRVVLELKHLLTILVGVEGGSQELDGESMTLLACPLNVYPPLNIVSLQIDSTGLENPPIVVVERQVDVPDTDVPSALSM